MGKIRTFYHYTRFIKEIKKDGLLLATSFAKTYAYDWILENCPEEFLSKDEIKRFKAYQHQNKKLIDLYKKEQDDEENYESCYRDFELNYKNKLLDEFFNNEGYVLAFSKKFQEGWLKGSNDPNYVASIFSKIGNKYVKFRITDKNAKHCYVLEQKFWDEQYHKPILKKKFGKDWDKLSKAFEKDMFMKKQSKLKDYLKFKKFFINLLFAKYYKSIVRLDKYKGNFKVPEFWIGEDIPISRCQFGEVSFKELEAKTGVTRKEVVKRKMTRADISERKKKSSKSSIARQN